MTVIELIQALQNLSFDSYDRNIYYKTGNMIWPVIDIHEDEVSGQKIIIMEWKVQKKENN